MSTFLSQHHFNHVFRYPALTTQQGSTSPNVPPAKRRRMDSPQQSTIARPKPNGHLPAKPPPTHNPIPAPKPAAVPPPAQSGPYTPTFFNQSSGRSERLAASIIDSEPLDEFSQEIADWIDHFTQNLNPDHVEVGPHHHQSIPSF